jgi:hypothetical protein
MATASHAAHHHASGHDHGAAGSRGGGQVKFGSANPQMEYLLEGLAAEAQRQGQQTRYKAYLTVHS